MANTGNKNTTRGVVSVAAGRLNLIGTHVAHRCCNISNNSVNSTKASPQQQEEEKVIYAKFDDGYIIRQMVRSDLPVIEELHAKEGIVSCDFEVAFDSLDDKRGLIVGEYEGRPVAFSMTYRWSSLQQSPAYYYGSGFIVDKSLRDRRFGSRILARDLEIINCKPEDCVVGDAVDAHRLQANVHRHGSAFHSVVEAYYLDFVPDSIPHPPSTDISTVDCADVSLDAIMDYDALCFVSKHFAPRREFLRRWFRVRPGAAYAALDTRGHIVGYACRRLARYDEYPDKKFHLIGPLYADNATVAETLILRHMRDVIGESIGFCIVTLNTDAVSVVNRLGMARGQQFFRNQWPGRNRALLQHSPRLYVPTSLDVCGF